MPSSIPLSFHFFLENLLGKGFITTQERCKAVMSRPFSATEHRLADITGAERNVKAPSLFLLLPDRAILAPSAGEAAHGEGG
jgi:hypothetical protein